MPTITRRDFFKKAAVLGAASALGSTALAGVDAFAQECGIFNIVLHGLFVIDLATGFIQVSAPNVTGNAIIYPHSYRAGSWRNSLSHFTPVAGEHEPIWPLPLTNAVIRDVPILKTEKMGKPDHTKAYLSLILPTPQAITGLRTFDAAEISFPTQYMDAVKFPLVTVLSYNAPPMFAPIPGTPWDSKNYHVFAEPEHPMDCSGAAATHGQAALDILWAMFGNHPPTGSGPKPMKPCSPKGMDPHPSVRCVTHDEEMSLVEMMPLKLGTEGVHMPTCAVFVAP
jgi:hypothetical protein